MLHCITQIFTKKFAPNKSNHLNIEPYIFKPDAVECIFFLLRYKGAKVQRHKGFKT